MKLETKAQLRNLKMSPRKVRLVVDVIRGLKADAALDQLYFSQKNSAKPVAKLIKSAIANAKHNHNIDEKTLVVKTAFVDGGAMQYRWMPRAMGRATPIRKRTSHITLVLEGDAEDKVIEAEVEEKENDESIESKKKATTKKKITAKKSTKTTKK